MKKDKKTILLVGGGTGGHIVPLINIGKKLKQLNPGLRIITVGGKTYLDRKLFKQTDNFILLTTGKLHRRLTLDNLAQFIYLTYGLLKSYFIILRVKPDLIFSKAGYVSFPIIFWAKILKIPYMIHESDIVMGSSNKIAARDAIKIFVGFPSENYPKTLEDKIFFTGQILRPEISELSEHTFDFGFTNKKPVIFITGGSQGSRNINNAIFNSLDRLLEKYNLIHHVGSLDYDKAVEIRAKLDEEKKSSYFVTELLTTINSKDSMLSAISQSDLAVLRSSATTLAEVSALKKPIITVPYKHASSSHQEKNALFYKKQNAAVVLNDDEVNDKLASEIDRLFINPKEMKKLASNAFGLFPINGLEKIADEIVTFIKYEEL
ncbi:MAG: UDP-N-acetylglucosamine--N-acetylmuramyl-(pentapeptide) pyrophosphoryl-undecaprenol N-acetylglucosamine transferase [Patescibacteria group bacterium]|nr:UDP-N-acetylglucosamine--N-acetylmuramyl-(pentapeptide) pyrophosphoryl-undecaprenol N-acetylglucosamine transferase [Patescibacteria group bacterium]